MIQLNAHSETKYCHATMIYSDSINFYFEVVMEKSFPIRDCNLSSSVPLQGIVFIIDADPGICSLLTREKECRARQP